MKNLKVFYVFYILLNFCLLLYSYTQVDLSLTLSRASIFQVVEKLFQYIGWYQRPLSTAIFLTIIALLSVSYLYLLFLAYKNRIERKTFWKLVIGMTAILTLSYNAFSYDLFNYIFAAKEVTFYHQSPFTHIALDFPGDPMLSFMRWTHNTYSYGPLGLIITLPASVLGFNIFFLTFFLFKAMTSLFFLGTIWAMGKIADSLKLDRKYFPLVFFAFNPLVIIECLVSSHNDIAMMFFAMLGFYMFLQRKTLTSISLIVASALIKFVTAGLLLPVILSQVSEKFYKKLSNENILRLTVATMFAGFIYVITKVEIQPWYFLWVLPFVGFLKPNRFLLSITICFTLGLVLTYVPLLYINNAVNGLPYKLQILPISLIVGAVVPFAYSLRNKLA